MTKICAKIVSKNILQEQKHKCQQTCTDTLGQIASEADLLKNVITRKNT